MLANIVLRYVLAIAGGWALVSCFWALGFLLTLDPTSRWVEAGQVLWAVFFMSASVAVAGLTAALWAAFKLDGIARMHGRFALLAGLAAALLASMSHWPIGK